MAKEPIEGVVLKPTSISLNPDDLVEFDELVGIDQRSKEIRNLIRNYVQANKCTEDTSSSTGKE